ncbi:MAG: hypothetical protein RR324_00165 [Cellulosilyticaceae bacterium]
MKRILAYGLIGATILASQSSIFATDSINSPITVQSMENEAALDEMQALLDYRVEQVCKALNKDIEEVSKQEILDAINEL